MLGPDPCSVAPTEASIEIPTTHPFRHEDSKVLKDLGPPWETGRKDVVIAYPKEVTRVKAKFDLPGLYVWHCHIRA